MLLRFLCLLSLVLSTVFNLLMGAFDSLTWLWLLPLLALGCLLVFLILAFLVLVIMASCVKLDKEQEYDSKLYRKVTEMYLEAALPPLRWNIKSKGMDKVPVNGRFMLVCNHVSLADPIVLLRVFAGYQVAFISKRENQTMFLIGKFMHKLLCQPINRENDREALKTIIKCIQILKEDKASIGVFPEGYILPHRKLHHFRPGVFKIAQKAQVPIVVCTLKGTRELIPNLAHLRHTDVELKVVTVLSVEELTGRATTDIAQQVYEIMAADLGPENVAEED